MRQAFARSVAGRAAVLVTRSFGVATMPSYTSEGEEHIMSKSIIAVAGSAFGHGHGSLLTGVIGGLAGAVAGR